MSALTPRLRGLVALTGIAAAAVVGLYVIFVRLPIGQRWDDRALLGGLLASEDARKALTAALHGIRISTLILMVALLLVIGLLRHRFAIALLATLGFGGAVVSAEVLKRVLPRRDLAPELNAYVDNGNIDTYPGGHSTIAMAFALALILVTSPRYRAPVAVAAMLWAAAVPVATLAAGWHRPSDVLGGIALGLAWLAGIAALAVLHSGHVMPTPTSMRILPLAGAAVITLCVVGLLVWIWRGDPSAIPVGGGLAAFAVAIVAIALVAVVSVGLYAEALRGLSFDRRRGASGDE